MIALHPGVEFGTEIQLLAKEHPTPPVFHRQDNKEHHDDRKLGSP